MDVHMPRGLFVCLLLTSFLFTPQALARKRIVHDVSGKIQRAEKSVHFEALYRREPASAPKPATKEPAQRKPLEYLQQTRSPAWTPRSNQVLCITEGLGSSYMGEQCTRSIWSF